MANTKFDILYDAEQRVWNDHSLTLKQAVRLLSFLSHAQTSETNVARGAKLAEVWGQ